MPTQIELDRRELKRQARESMGLAQPPFWVAALLVLLLTDGLSQILDLILAIPGATEGGVDTVSLFVTILFSLYATVITFGYRLWALWTSRRMDPGLGALLQGFSVAGQVIWMEIGINVRVFLYCIPLVLTAAMLVLLTDSLFLPLLALALLFFATWMVTLRYALAPYLLADHPDDGATVAIHRSSELMRGWKWELGKLELSFLGWEILRSLLSCSVLGYFLWKYGFFDLIVNSSTLTLYNQYLSITDQFLPALLSMLLSLPVTLWLEPYREVSRAAFYDARMQAQRESAPNL
jgi:hypothetical protein